VYLKVNDIKVQIKEIDISSAVVALNEYCEEPANELRTVKREK
jgi:hypothetical protein